MMIRRLLSVRFQYEDLTARAGRRLTVFIEGWRTR
jgi:hypothetical protein